MWTYYGSITIAASSDCQRSHSDRYKKKLVSILQRLEKEGKIRKKDKKFLYLTTENIPRMYGSPKIQKDGTPLRPIVDFAGSVGYNVAIKSLIFLYLSLDKVNIMFKL